ncbi:hypothetical protein ACFQ6N_24705 [Kitasatospora sp. NPDC056446]|uniref:hypothetical protein n=1 Tax=Kitasatospora sp. NPDC056446 TaxID=3345819 RepID=UPI00368FFCE9
MNKTVSRTLMTGLVALATVIGLSGTAFAGTVTWTHKSQTSYCLSVTSGLHTTQCYWSSGMGGNYTDGVTWNDIQQGDGAWLQSNINHPGNCLDGNYGQAYLNPCSSGNNWQHWWENSTTNGWMLVSAQTNYALDANNSGSVYTNPPQDGNVYQHWI